MARKKANYKIIDGIKFYTANYFSEKTFTTTRTARNFLQDFESLEGHTNPKLYTENDMMTAVAMYNDSHSASDIEEKIEQMRASREEYEREAQDEAYSNEIPEKDPFDLTKDIEKRYKDELPTMLLQHVLFALEYEFDSKQFYEDIQYDEYSEKTRMPGEPRTKKHRQVRKRLESTHGYLIKKRS